ncbi:MAG: hypothetical protein KME64_16295 [Scytonematopsis contorta HA4267-MV1]|nr:hypothetical protein [Scytonematopsis contorta HA4267-MV1]
MHNDKLARLLCRAIPDSCPFDSKTTLLEFSQ